jgi:hypothetical protein
MDQFHTLDNKTHHCRYAGILSLSISRRIPPSLGRDIPYPTLQRKKGSTIQPVQVIQSLLQYIPISLHHVPLSAEQSMLAEPYLTFDIRIHDGGVQVNHAGIELSKLLYHSVVESGFSSVFAHVILQP